MITMRVTYEHKKTLERHDLSFKYAPDANNALKIAKRLRPKGYRIVSMIIFQLTTPAQELDDSIFED